jgi:hypothetical protein
MLGKITLALALVVVALATMAPAGPVTAGRPHLATTAPWEVGAAISFGFGEPSAPGTSGSAFAQGPSTRLS